MISSFIHSKVVVTRVKSLENDRQGRSRREYSVPESAVWSKMFKGNRERRHGQRLLLYLARLFKFRSRPHPSACAFHCLSSFLFFTFGDGSVHRVEFVLYLKSNPPSNAAGAGGRGGRRGGTAAGTRTAAHLPLSLQGVLIACWPFLLNLSLIHI